MVMAKIPALLICFVLWAILGVVLSLNALPAWTGALRQIYDAMGHASPLNYAALGRAGLSHVSALPYLAVMLVCAYGAGGPLRRLLALRASPAASAALQLASGWSVMALIQHGLGLTGLLFPLLLRGEVGLLVLCGALAVVGERPWRSWRWSALSGERVPCTLILLLLLVLVLLTRLPDVHEDARALHFAAPEHYVLLHKINAEPQHIGFHIARGTEMMFLIPWALGGITLAKLVNVGLVLTTMLLLHALVGCLRVGLTGAASGAGWWACLWYVSAGLVMDECWQGKNDLAGAMFVMAGAWCAVEAVQARRRWWLGAAWFLGAAVGTKYTMAFFLIALAAPAGYYARRWLTWGKAATGGVLVLVPMGGWLLESFLFLGNPFYPFLSGLFEGISWGPFYANAFHEYRRAISPAETQLARDWLVGLWRVLGEPSMGSLGLFALLPCALIWLRGRGATFLLVSCLLAYLLWLSTARFGRYLAPLLPLVAVLVSVVEVRGGLLVETWFRRGRLALAGVVLLVALMNASRYLAPSGWLYLAGQITAGDLLQRQFTTWEDVRLWINRNVSPTARVLFTGEERRLWFTPRVISYTSVTEPVFWRLTLDSFSVEEMRKRVRQRGITHHLHNFVSAEYRGTFWYAGPPWSQRQLVLYQQFVRKHVRPLRIPARMDFDNGGFYVFEITSSPSLDEFPVPFLPFTEGRFRQARFLCNAGRFQEALAEAKRAAAPMQDVFQAQLALGAVHFGAGNYATAMKLLKPGIVAGFVSTWGGWNLSLYGAAAINRGLYDQGIQVLTRAWQLYREPQLLNTLALGLVGRGQIKEGQGDLNSALRDFYQARSILSDPRVRTRLGQKIQYLETLSSESPFE